jgi:hypothetical protein
MILYLSVDGANRIYRDWAFVAIEVVTAPIGVTPIDSF